MDLHFPIFGNYLHLLELFKLFFLFKLYHPGYFEAGIFSFLNITGSRYV